MEDQRGDTSGLNIGPAEETADAPDAATSDPAQEMAAAVEVLKKSVASGGNWFYWIVGLSVINTVIMLFKGDWSFVVGLGATQVVDAVMSEYGKGALIIGLPINLVIWGMYILFGYFACRRAKWAFILGMIVYSLDALIFLAFRDWLPFGFHVFALWCISRGLSAENMARRIEKQMLVVQGQG